MTTFSTQNHLVREEFFLEYVDLPNFKSFNHEVSVLLEMQYTFATAVILYFFAAIIAFSFFETYALFLTS